MRTTKTVLLLAATLVVTLAACTDTKDDKNTADNQAVTETADKRDLTAEETALLVTIPDGPVAMEQLEDGSVEQRVVVDTDGNVEYTIEDGRIRKVDGIWYIQTEELLEDADQWVQLRIADDSWLITTLFPDGAGWRDFASTMLNEELWWPAYCLTEQNVAAATKVENGWEYSCDTETEETQSLRAILVVTTDQEGRVASIEGPGTITFDYEPETVQAPEEFLSGSRADAWLMDLIAEVRTPEIKQQLADFADKLAEHVLRTGDASDTELLENSWDAFDTFYTNPYLNASFKLNPEDLSPEELTLELPVPGSAVVCEVALSFENGEAVRGEPVCESKF